MFIRITKVLLALGLTAAASSGNAFYVVGGNMIYGRYCAQVLSGSSGRGVMESTMPKCQQKLQDAIAQASFITGIEACHSCAQKFETLQMPDMDPVTGTEPTIQLPLEAVQLFLDRSQQLREYFRIDEYERAQLELQRLIRPESAL